jgi:hypothetical protein
VRLCRVACTRLDAQCADIYLVQAQKSIIQENYRMASAALEQALSLRFEVRQTAVYHILKAKLLDANGQPEEAIKCGSILRLFLASCTALRIVCFPDPPCSRGINPTDRCYHCIASLHLYHIAMLTCSVPSTIPRLQSCVYFPPCVCVCVFVCPTDQDC